LPASDFLELPPRRGLTHVLDKGLGITATRELLDAAGDYVDIVKLGWGTSYVIQNLDAKLELLRSYAKPVVPGGTFIEAVYVRGKLDEYKSWLAAHGFTHIEISDGTVDIPRERKLELIADFARDFTVLSEVGSKDPSVELEIDQWTGWLREELEAGAWKVITEAREGASSGIFAADGTMRTSIIVDVAAEVGADNVIFEAPTKASQAWFINELGPHVNLGNIAPDDVIPLETLRLGLRSDTLKEVLGANEPTAAS
jgi:phosphosulfolactate synthase